MKIYTLIGIILAAVLLAVSTIGCQPTQPSSSSPPASTIGPTPKPPAPSEEVRTPEPEYFVLDADTVAIGTVGQGSTPSGQGNSIYSYWVFNVEEYIIKPLPETTMRIRIWERDGGLPIKGVHLREGEHLLVFLKKQGDFFVFAGGMMEPGKFTVQDGRIQYSFYGGSPWESLDSAMSRIKAVADTWAGESLTSERRAQVVNIALDDPSIKEFLVGRQYEITNVSPYLVGFVPGEIRYVVNIQSPNQQQWEAHLVTIVNATGKKVDKLILNVSSTGFTEADMGETQRIVLADKTVQETIGDRGYEVFLVSIDYWQEVQDGKTLFHIFPVVELFLYPRGSENLYVFIDLNQKKVVKIFTESRLSQNPLESTGVDRNFTLTITIPKTEYRVGETAEAVMTLKYTGSDPVELSSPGGEYFNLFLRDTQNNMLYRWRDDKYPQGNLTGVLPLVKETIESGWSATGRLQFRVPQAGTLYLKGLTFNDGSGYQVTVSQGSGGYGVNADTPFLVIQAR